LISNAPPPQMSEMPLAPGHSIVSREEKVEYRDQNGNLLDPEEVKKLEGKVSFETRFETRTRIIDADGNEIVDPEAVGVAPPHPDVEGVDRETVGIPEQAAQDRPAAQKDVAADASKEENVGKSDNAAAKPASEGNDATGA
jgi:dolichyl-phosphate-mannose-protein mannosyltransferase